MSVALKEACPECGATALESFEAATAVLCNGCRAVFVGAILAAILAREIARVNALRPQVETPGLPLEDSGDKTF